MLHAPVQPLYLSVCVSALPNELKVHLWLQPTPENTHSSPSSSLHHFFLLFLTNTIPLRVWPHTSIHLAVSMNDLLVLPSPPLYTIHQLSPFLCFQFCSFRFCFSQQPITSIALPHPLLILRPSILSSSTPVITLWKKKPIRRLCDVEMGGPWRCLLRWLFIEIGAVFVRSPRTETDVQGMLPSSPPGPFVLDTLYSLSRWAWLCNYRLGKRVCLFNSQTAWAV